MVGNGVLGRVSEVLRRGSWIVICMYCSMDVSGVLEISCRVSSWWTVHAGNNIPVRKCLSSRDDIQVCLIYKVINKVPDYCLRLTFRLTFHLVAPKVFLDRPNLDRQGAGRLDTTMPNIATRLTCPG